MTPAHGHAARKHSAEMAKATRHLTTTVLTCPHGALYYLLLTQERKETKWTRPVQHQPTAKARAAPGVQVDASSCFTRARRRVDPLPSPRRVRRRGGWSRPPLEELLPEGESLKLGEPRAPLLARLALSSSWSVPGLAGGRGRHLRGSTQRGDHLPQTPSRRGRRRHRT